MFIYKINSLGLYGLKNGEYVKQLNDQFMDLAPMTLMYEHTCPTNHLLDVSKKIHDFYLNDKQIDESTKFDVINVSK